MKRYCHFPSVLARSLLGQVIPKQRSSSDVTRFFSILSSIEPVQGTIGYSERPGTIIYAESSLYSKTSKSWVKCFEKEIPQRGLHFVNISVFDISSKEEWKKGNPYAQIREAEIELANDISSFPCPVLVTRGGLPSMVAQFYLESFALSGLVMVDPFVLPEIASSSATSSNRTSISCRKLFQEVSLQAKSEMQDNCAELHLLQLLSSSSESPGKEVRMLKLEPSSVPMLLLYPSIVSAPESSNEEWYKSCVEITAEYHNSIEETVNVQHLKQEPKVLEALDAIVSWLDNKVS